MFLKALCCAVAVAVVVTASTIDTRNADAAFQFAAYQTKFGKSYETAAEWDNAFHNFQASVKRIAEKEARVGPNIYGLNKFSDLTEEEFRSRYLMRPGAIDIEGMAQRFAVKPKHTHAPPPDTFDWRSKNAVTPVKNQEQCGSCWAFSVTEMFESMWFLAGNALPVLGPQQLVDCDPQSFGCSGGWTYWALEYLMKAGGQEAEADYPYTAENGACKFDNTKIVAKLTNFTFATTVCHDATCPIQDDLLRQQLVAVGPLSICVDAQPWFDWNGPAPLPGSECPGGGTYIDHCVQLVGYDWPNNYWIARNSWGADWGQQGFIYLQTGQNTCGLGDVVTYADVTANHHRKH